MTSKKTSIFSKPKIIIGFVVIALIYAIGVLQRNGDGVLVRGSVDNFPGGAILSLPRTGKLAWKEDGKEIVVEARDCRLVGDVVEHRKPDGTFDYINSEYIYQVKTETKN